MSTKKPASPSHSQLSNSQGSNNAKTQFSGVLISPEDIIFVKDIKSGMQGRVYKARIGNAIVAVKETKINLASQSLDSAKRNLIKEVQIMSEVNHENICLFLGACLIPDKMMLVSELCQTDLDDHMKKLDSLFSRIELSRDICKGMAWLHDVCCIVHLDLKPANLLIDKHNRIKITDFGYSQILPSQKLSSQSKERGDTGGTPRYMAPERFVEGNTHSDPSVDVYSFGIILWEMVTLTLPFKEHDNMQKFVSAVYRGERPPVKDIKNSRLTNVMQLCWDSSPKNRPPFTDILPLLDKILLHMAIPDREASEFWVKIAAYSGYAVDSNHSSSQTKQATTILPISVPWSSFVSGLEVSIKKHQKHHMHQNPVSIASVPLPPTHLKSQLPAHPTLEEIQYATTTALKLHKQKYPDFAEAFENEMERRTLLTKVYALKKLLVDKDKNSEVDIQSFGKLVATLGWKAKNDSCPGVGLLDTVFDLVQKSWFYPYSSKETSYDVLKNSPVGTFVIRFSHSSNGFALSKVIKEPNNNLRVVHFLLDGNPERGYALSGTDKYFPTIQAFVESDSTLVAPQGNTNHTVQVKDLWDPEMTTSSQYQFENIDDNNNTSAVNFQLSNLRDMYLMSARGLNRDQILSRIERLKNEKSKIFSTLVDSDSVDEDKLKRRLGEILTQMESLTNALGKSDDQQ